ncbi:membrane protein [Mycobacterium phage Chaser]|uniref:Uncharacterized protein n=1 Tax=Mycobacterium phage DyoEdafos TaxID=2599860 RepID=A0A5J6TJU3_9CAUD|nr:hypothetical protein J4U00_gp043 [Mycobacterium phage DyoEdafos]QFG10274.1 hypothetical protein SEA_DYOEDAFOS_43 [Mycobacterium phage DyoEdafos]QXO14378.1 membrane protein [Mycobacterium phage Chaser]
MSDQALRDNVLAVLSLLVLIAFMAVILNAWFTGW